jgi:hypothetical protein
MAQVHHILTEVPRFHGFLKILLLAITCGQPPSGSQLLRLRLAQKATRLPTRSLFLSAFYQHSISIPSAFHQRPISVPSASHQRSGFISGPVLSAVENEEGQRYPRWPSWRCSLASGHPLRNAPTRSLKLYRVAPRTGN